MDREWYVPQRVTGAGGLTTGRRKLTRALYVMRKPEMSERRNTVKRDTQLDDVRVLEPCKPLGSIAVLTPSVDTKTARVDRRRCGISLIHAWRDY